MIPVVIATNGMGIPVVAVEKNGVPAIVSENGRGIPIVIVERNGVSMIIEGLSPITVPIEVQSTVDGELEVINVSPEGDLTLTFAVTGEGAPTHYDGEYVVTAAQVAALEAGTPLFLVDPLRKDATTPIVIDSPIEWWPGLAIYDVDAGSVVETFTVLRDGTPISGSTTLTRTITADDQGTDLVGRHIATQGATVVNGDSVALAIPAGSSEMTDDFSAFTVGQDIPTVSAGWEYRAQRFAATMKSDGSGNAVFTEGTAGFWRVFARRTEAVAANQKAGVIASAVAGTGRKFFGALARVTETGSSALWAQCYMAQADVGNNQITLQRWATSAPSTLGTVAYTFTANDRLDISAVAEGADVRLKVFLNGTEIISFLDNSVDKITTGKPGVYGGGENTNCSSTISAFFWEEL